MRNVFNLKNSLVALFLTVLPIVAFAESRGGAGPGGGDLVKGKLADFWINEKIERVNPIKLKGYEKTKAQLAYVASKVPVFAADLEKCGQSKKWILTNKTLDQGTLESPVKLPNRTRLARQNKYEVRIDLKVYKNTKGPVAGDTWFHELVRCTIFGASDETIQDLNIELHDETRTPEQLVEIIESHGGASYQTAATIEEDRLYIERMTTDYNQSLEIKSEFYAKVKDLESFCDSDLRVPSTNILMMNSALSYIGNMANFYDQKASLDPEILWDSRTRQQKFYYNISQVLSAYLGNMLAYLVSYEHLTEEDFEKWVSTGALPKVKSSRKEADWNICRGLSPEHSNFDWVTRNIGFDHGTLHLGEGFGQSRILSLSDPLQFTSWDTRKSLKYRKK